LVNSGLATFTLVGTYVLVLEAGDPMPYLCYVVNRRVRFCTFFPPPKPLAQRQQLCICSPHQSQPSQPFGGLIPLGNTSAYQQLNTGDGQALTLATAQRAGQKAIPFFKPTANSSAVAQPAAGRRLLGAPAAAAATVADIEAQPRSVSKKATPAQAEAEAATPQAVENLYSLGAVAPGASVRYEWYVPDAAAPGPGDGDAVAYAYVSGVDQIKHTNAGLVGAVVVYKKGGLGKDGGNATHGGGGVRELPLLFNIQDEMLSKFFEFNLARQQSGSKVPLDKKVHALLCAYSFKRLQTRLKHNTWQGMLPSLLQPCLSGGAGDVLSNRSQDGSRLSDSQPCALGNPTSFSTKLPSGHHVPGVQHDALHQRLCLLQRPHAEDAFGGDAARNCDGLWQRGGHALSCLPGANRPQRP
jgi:hypothetical protein